MKKASILITVLVFLITISCNLCQNEKNKEEQETVKINHPILGKWVRIGHSGPISFNFTEKGIVENDFGNDQSVDVTSNYEISGDTISFIDKDGSFCNGTGQYKMHQTDYYLAFELMSDDCGGRIKTTLGFWTKPNFNELLKQLDEEIAKKPNPELLLNRARIYMATGMMDQTRKDFDTYLLSDTLNARVYLNRAGTRFPFDLKGVVNDCNKAISIDANQMNAYFLRGLARYELGEKEEACEDFNKAIELGFSVLRVAEQEKCIEYWNKA